MGSNHSIYKNVPIDTSVIGMQGGQSYVDTKNCNNDCKNQTNNNNNNNKKKKKKKKKKQQQKTKKKQKKKNKNKNKTKQKKKKSIKYAFEKKSKLIRLKCIWYLCHNVPPRIDTLSEKRACHKMSNIHTAWSLFCQILTGQCTTVLTNQKAKTQKGINFYKCFDLLL